MSAENSNMLSNTAAWLQAAIHDAHQVATAYNADLAGAQKNSSNSENTGDNDTDPVIPDPERKLAAVRVIDNIRRFNSQLDILTIDGWTVVARSGFLRGEFVLFVEPDSFLLASGGRRGKVFSQVSKYTSDFMGERGYRVGTKAHTDINGKRILSQGHVFSLRNFPQVLRIPQDIQYRDKGRIVNSQITRAVPVDDPDCAWNALLQSLLGVDYSGVLGVKKWTTDSDAMPKTEIFPSPIFIQDSGSKRVQECPNLYVKSKYKYATFQESVKLDGAAMSCYFVTKTSKCFFAAGPAPPSEGAMFPNGRFGVCSRNCELFNKNNIYWNIALNLKLDTKLRDLGLSLVLQGELVGSSINGNPYRYPEGQHEFFLYSMIDLDNQAGRIHPRRVEEYAKILGIKHVPVLGYVNLWKIATSNEGLIRRAETRDGEGLVFKNVDDGRWFKVLSREWIIHRGDEVRAAKATEEAALRHSHTGQARAVSVSVPKLSAARAKVVAFTATTSPSSTRPAPRIPSSTASDGAVIPAGSTQSKSMTITKPSSVHSAKTPDTEGPGPEAVETETGISGPKTAEVSTIGADTSVAATTPEVPTGILIDIDDETDVLISNVEVTADLQTPLMAGFDQMLPAYIHTPPVNPTQYVMAWLLSIDMHFWAPLSHRLMAMYPDPEPFLTKTEIRAMHNGDLTIFDFNTDFMYMAVDEWRRRSMARSLNARDGGLGTSVALWAASTWGNEAPEVNDVYAKVQEVKFSMNDVDEIVWKICGLTDLKNMAATEAERKALVEARDRAGLALGLQPGWSMHI